MKVILAKTAGYCFGVNNAVNMMDELLQKSEKGENTCKVYMLGPIIHNKLYLDDAKARGAKIINSVSEADDNSILVIRAHGVGTEIYEQARTKNLIVYDATCPYVKKIHVHVDKKVKNGYNIIIVGDPQHPEVEGIKGWAGGHAYVITDKQTAEALSLDDCRKISVVAQTTITSQLWQSVKEILEKKFGKNIEFHKTICRTTSERQTEALEIAAKVGIMLIIGDKGSSNTRKLFELCSNVCPKTMILESASDLSTGLVSVNSIGITAGASTPDRVVREVLGRMNELVNKENEMDFSEVLKQHEEANRPVMSRGSTVNGTVIAVKENEISVDLAFKYDGIIKKEEITDQSDAELESMFNVGDEILVYVIRVNEKDGIVELSRKRIENLKNAEFLKERKESGEPVEVNVTEIVNGGVLANYKGTRIFIPASQLSEKYARNLDKFKGQTLRIRITEFNPGKRKVIGSAKVILLEEKKIREDNFWNKIEVGLEIEGIVRSIADFGVFVDVGGYDGLIHISELSWNRIKHPSEVMSVGDKINVKVLDFNREKGKLSLGYRKPEDNPWQVISEKYNVGDIVSAKVVRIVPFGAFVEIEEGADGLVHISRISSVRIGKVEEVLKVGQIVEAKILEIDLDNKRISLSIKDVNPIDPMHANDFEVSMPKSKSAAKKEKNEDEAYIGNVEEMSNTIGEIINSDELLKTIDDTAE